MKKILIVITLLFLVGCSAAPAPVAEAPPAEPAEQSAGTSDDKDSTIAVLEYQVEDLTTKNAELQAENDALKAQMSEVGDAVEAPAGFMCEGHEQLFMRYENPQTAIAILEGWFAGQPRVGELQGTYSTQFWNDVNSRIHTIRYLSSADGLTTTDTFLIMFEEGGWQPGILWMTESCWLDHPS
jgi:hypothetical protein